MGLPDAVLVGCEDFRARWTIMHDRLDDGEGSEGIDLNWRPPCVVLVVFLLSA